jgi:putative tryptophan/tyrosine transport system substrate-binding protein
MIRRVLLVLVCGLAGLTAAVLGSPFSRAAEPAQRVMQLGFVSPNSPSTDARGPAAFWGRLRELGWVEGQNLVIEARWAEGRYDRLPALMAEVIGRKVDALVTYGTPAAIAAKKATSTVPIVVAVMGNPVGTGLVQGLARPGGNLTGLSLGWGEGIGGKLLELLQETVPRLTTVAVIGNPDNPVDRDLITELQGVAPARRLKLRIIEVRDPQALERAFEQTRRQAQAVVVIPDPVFLAHLQRITALAARHRLPAMYGQREFADAGGLMAYGPDRTVMFRRAADYVDKILRGAKPADLPIEQPTQYVFVVNLKTAKALGITIPESILLRADEVVR